MRLVGWVVAAGLASTALVACSTGGGDGPDRGGSEQSPSAEPSPEPTAGSAAEEPEAPTAFRQARRRLIGDGSGAFRSEMEIGGGTLVLDGTYDLDAETTQYVVETRSPQGTLVFEAIGTADVSWLRFVQTGFIEDGTCWLEVDTATSEVLQGVPAPAVSTLGVPPAPLVVVYGRGTSWIEPGRVLRGTTDLHVLAAATGGVADSLAIDPRSTDRVSLDFQLEEGRVVGWEARLGDVLDAVEQGGRTLPAEVEEVRSMLEQVAIVATLDDPGEAVTIERPDPRKVVALDPGAADDPTAEAEIDAEFEACEAG